MLFSLFDNLTQPKPAPAEHNLIEQEFEITVNGEPVPVRIVFEQRFNNRVSVNKNGILIRISGRQEKEEQRKQIDTLLKWAKERLGDKPELLESLPQRKYINGEILRVGTYEFVISVFYHEGAKSTAKIFKNNIMLSMARGLNKDAEANTASYLVAKCLCKFFQPVMTERLHELNNRFFKKNLQSLKMKYATSFWGHCSHNGHIVISVRLMFAPPRTIDYVLIHELAHLVHHDHSARFWKLVEQVMPDYREHEKILQANHLKYYL
ncbi:MAG TPA: M48 family metallopeptidase [Chitinophagales bacterium]|nr:M48 family metallopeptidase [Chitinophagales bacterium]